MPSIRLTAVAAALAASAIAAAPAAAHSGNPDYESLVTRVTPSLPGLTIEMLNGDDRLGVVNESHRTIVFGGYQGEPFLRMQGDGTVSVNLRSPAYYLDQVRNDVDGVRVPSTADPKAAPQWKVVSRNSRYEFHDHRTHWMAARKPSQVKDDSERTKIFDWKVPLSSAGKTGAVAGTLYWRGSDGGAPVGAFVAFGVLLAAGAAAVVVTRRRRRSGPGTGAPTQRGEAW